jgi:hypothetical protein
MTDAEISRRLALAIGWKDVIPGEPDGCYVVDHAAKRDRWFDYLDPAVIWPIAERFDCFPAKTPWDDSSRKWSAFLDDSWNSDQTTYIEADTSAKAVALAVIKAHEAKK